MLTMYLERTCSCTGPTTQYLASERHPTHTHMPATHTLTHPSGPLKCLTADEALYTVDKGSPDDFSRTVRCARC